jgi:hypothetical protein
MMHMYREFRQISSKHLMIINKLKPNHKTASMLDTTALVCVVLWYVSVLKSFLHTMELSR